MELDDFLYTSAGRGRYACFTGTNRLMFITHRTNKYTELDEVKMVTKGGCTWVQLRMKENLNLEVAKAIAHLPCLTAIRIAPAVWTTIWKWLSKPVFTVSI